MRDFLHLVLNLFIVIKPVFIYQLVWFRFAKAPGTTFNVWLIGVCSAASLMLSLLFPFQPLPELSLDFRIVPLVLGMAYGGWLVGGVLLAITGIYTVSVYTAANGLLFGMVFVLLAGYGVGLRRLRKKEEKLRVQGGMIVSLAYATAVASLHAHAFFHKPGIGLLALALFLSVCVIASTVSLILMGHSVQALRDRQYAEQTDKLEALGGMAVSVVHELRNPLTAVVGFLRLLKEPELSPEKQEQYLSVLTSEIQGMKDKLQLYYDIALPTGDCREPIRLADVVRTVLKDLETPALEKGIRLDCRCDLPVSVIANFNRLYDCVFQLFRNGMESLPSGGRLTVRLDCHDHLAELYIADEGMTLTPDAIRQLGTPFYSTKREGTGLDMLLAYRYIESMQGQLLVESRSGGGTTRTIRLPLAEKEIETG